MLYLKEGYIGCFEMKDKDSGKRQLEEYVNELRASGHKRIIAPINGSTWHSYRLVSWSSGEDAFPLEPQNPLWYNEVYEEAGFSPLQKYRSDKFPLSNVTKNSDADTSLCLRGFCKDDLKLIYDISLKGFKDNFLFSDIGYDDFVALYQPILPAIDEELAIIAEVDNVPAGFMFSFVAGESLILKTMAVLPEFRSRGVGAKMINSVLYAGQQKGLKSAVAALISDGNHSHNIVSKYGSEKIREYTLYCLEGL